MWYRYLNRTCDQIRLWRTTNLKFNQDEIGMFSLKKLSNTNEFLYRMARNEGNLRGVGIAVVFGLIGAFAYVKGQFYDPIFTAPKLIQQKKELDNFNKRGREQLFYNKFGAPTRPTRRLQQFMLFVQSPQALNKNFDFLMFGLDIHSDQLAGLDSYTSPEDQNMINYYKESKRRNAH